MKMKRQTGIHAYVGALSVTATLLALVICAFGAPAASANAISPAQADMLSALATRGAVVDPGTGYGPHGSSVVRGLQALLSEAGYPAGPIDGRYGPLTEQAVMRYQANVGLTVDGVAGPHTLASLAARRVVLGPGAGYPDGSPIVRHLQRLLADAGHSPGPIDGLFGPLTADAVMRYQADVGLPVDGIASQPMLAGLAGRVTVVRPGAGYEAGGSPIVRHLQRLLVRAGYSPGPVDGRYGPLTERAVRRYQANRDLPVNVIVGPRTFADLRLNSGARRPARGNPARATTPTAPASAQATPTTPAARTASSTAPQAPAPTAAAPAQASTASHTTSSIWIGWIALLALLAVGVGAGAVQYLRRRGGSSFMISRNARTRPPPKPRDAKAEEGPPAEQHPRDEQQADGEQRVPAVEHALGGQQAEAVQPAKAAEQPASGEANGAAGDRRREVEVVRGDENGGANGNKEPGDTAQLPTDINEAFNLGVLLEERGDLAGAEASYRRADDHGHAAAASNLGVLLEGHGDQISAEAAYRRADRRGEADGAFNLGVLLDAKEDLAGAEAAYRRADERGHAAAACNLGVLLEEQGDRIGAEAAYRRADRRGEANGSFNLGLLLEEQDDLAGAEAAYHRAEESGDPGVARQAHAALLDLVAGIAGASGGPDSGAVSGT